MARKGTVAIEKAVVNPDDLEWLADFAPIYVPGTDFKHHALSKQLADIHDERLQQMDVEGVEYMLLSLTSPGPQGEADPKKAQALAVRSNNWLAAEIGMNPQKFGALASVSMHYSAEGAAELRRAVRELGMFGAILNDFQTAGEHGEGKKYYDTEEYHVFWEAVQELDVPVYMHPRYPPGPDLEPGTAYGTRKHLLGAAVQFHLDLSFHLYALISNGIFDRFPKVQVVAGHPGEG